MSNQAAADVTVPVTHAGQVVSTNRDTVQRLGRTLLQLIAGGGLTALTHQLASDIPTAYVPYLMAFYTLIVTLAQNVAEAQGLIPIVLKKPPVAG